MLVLLNGACIAKMEREQSGGGATKSKKVRTSIKHEVHFYLLLFGFGGCLLMV